MDRLVESTVPVVLAESTRVTIERMAAEFVQDLLSDPTFKAEIRETVRRAMEPAVKELREPR